MKKIWNFIKIAFGVVLAIFTYMFFKKDKSGIKKKIEEVKAEAKKEEEKVKKIEKRIETRRKEAKTLAERLKKHFNIFIIIFVVFCFSVGVVAIDTIENLKIPETYSELLEAYRDVASIAIAYQRLYNEAEADNQALLKVIENLQSLLKVQQDIINNLLQKDKIGLFGGIGYVPLHPDYSSIMLGITFEF